MLSEAKHLTQQAKFALGNQMLRFTQHDMPDAKFIMMAARLCALEGRRNYAMSILSGRKPRWRALLWQLWQDD
jgi:hypothetical protein